MMDWPTAAVVMTAISGFIAGAVVGLIKLLPGRGQNMEQEPQQSQTLEKKIDDMQECVSKVETDVEVLKNSSAHTERDVNGLRTQIDGMRNEISALKDMLVKHILRPGNS